MTARIRLRTPHDLGQLAQLAARVQEVDGYPVYLRDGDYGRFLSRPEPLHALVAEIAGAVVGHVAVNASSSASVMQVARDAGCGDVGVIARLLVDPALRGRGIGRSLLADAASWVRSRGWTPILDVVASSTRPIALYRSAGWTQIGAASLSLPDGRIVNELVFVHDTDHMGDTFELRDFESLDQDPVRHLILDGLREHWGTADPTLNPELLDIASSHARGRTLVCTQAGKVVGTGTIIPITSSTAEIRRMSVASSARRQGLGRAILNELIETARRWSARTIVLETTTTWTDTVAFYTTAGFTPTETRRGQFGDETWFELQL